MSGQVIALVFEMIGRTGVRQIVGCVLELDDEHWLHVPLDQPIPVPAETVPTSAIASLHRQLAAREN